MNKTANKIFKISVFSLSVLVLAITALPASAADPANPPNCNADNSVVNIARSTGSAEVGETITFSVSAGNPASGDGCDITGRTMTLTLPDGSFSTFGPFDYPNPSATAFVGSDDYVADSADLDSGSWTATVEWDGALKDGYDNPSNGDKQISVANTPVNLEVTKTAIPAAEETYRWLIEKSVNPDVWHLFMGDSGTSEYTIDLVKELAGTTYSVSGTISIHNPAQFATAHVTDVADEVSGLGPVTVTCPSGSSFDIAPDETVVCTYSLDLPNPDARTNTATVTTSGDVGGDEDTVGFDPAQATPTVVNGEVNVDDTYDAGDGGPFSSSYSYTYTRQFVCGEGEYEGIGNPVENTAEIVETGDFDDASVTVNCYELDVTKDATTTYDREYNWEVTKVADATELELEEGELGTIHYTITADLDGDPIDSNHAVSGTITVHNPAPIDAVIADVTDVISDFGSVTAECGVTFPYTLVAGGTLECTYSSDLPDGDSRTNTATATQRNHDYYYTQAIEPTGTTDYSGDASVTFGDPTTVEDETVEVVDSLFGGVLGTATVGETLPKPFEYDHEVMYEGPEDCDDHIIDNTATLTELDTQDYDEASWSVLVHVNCEVGCTLTQGYWKTHSEQGPAAHPDATWDLIDGGEGPDTPFDGLEDTWLEVFNTSPKKGNVYYQLAHQYMAAKLNVLNDASTTPEVDAALTAAEALFGAHTPDEIGALKGNNPTRKEFISLAGILGSYNEGLIGPGHCDDDTPQYPI